MRFIHNQYEFNDIIDASNTRRNVRGAASNMCKVRTQPMVDIVCYCLMPNHFHLVLRQLIDGGIHKFMHKLATGYAMYFNRKYDRTGILFEGPFKAIPIKEDEYLTHLLRYIHLNPVDLVEPEWKENGIKDWESANKFLENYRWSSYMDYIGKHNFPSILNREPLGWYFKTPEEYKDFVQCWMQKNIKEIEEIIIE